MVSYTTAELVQYELQAASAFDTTTVPSLSTITTWIEEESAQIDNDAGVTFAQTTATVDLDYDYEEVLPMKGSPIITVNALTYNTNPIGSSSGTAYTTLADGSHYTIYEDRGEIVLLLTNFSPKAGRKRFKIDYTYGYAITPDVVQKLATKKVALRVLNTLIQKNVNERNDGGSVTVGSISIVEPTSYGVTSYKTLVNEIAELEKTITKDDGVHRYDIYTI